MKRLHKKFLACILFFICLCNLMSLPVSAAAPKVKSIKYTNAASVKYMSKGSSKKLKVHITPQKASKRKLKWSSSNKKIATVSSKGKVTAKKNGTVTITCKVASQPRKYVRCKIRVITPTEQIRFNTKDITLQTGDTVKYSASVSPSKASIRDVTYSSSNTKVAKVDKSGKVTGISPGTAVISVKAKDGFAPAKSYQIQIVKKVRDAAKFIAHRGLSSKAPENTIKAYELAGKEKFWGAETDIRKTADDQFILMHDNSLLRMCGIDLKVSDLTLEELQKIPITTGNYYSTYKGDASATTIPTLEEYLQTCIKYNMVPVIEIKMSLDFSKIEEDPVPDPEDADNTDTTDDADTTDDTDDTDNIDNTTDTDVPSAEILALQDIPSTEVDDQNIPLQSVGDKDLLSLYETTKKIMGDREVLFIAFDLQALVRLRMLMDENGDTHVKLQHLVQSIKKSNFEIYDQYRLTMSANNKNLDLDTIEEYVSEERLNALWTVDSLARIAELTRRNVTYITTNKSFW